MRIITDSDGRVLDVSFGALISCGGQDGADYTGTVPTGYTSLEDWYTKEGDKLYRWKIVDGELTLDSSAVAPVDLPVADYIVGQGTNGIWNYRKWASGVAECWGYDTKTVVCTTTYGSLYGGSVAITLPSGLFASGGIDCIQMTVGGSTGSGYAFFGRYASAANTGFSALFFSTASATKDITYSVEVRGKWK